MRALEFHLTRCERVVQGVLQRLRVASEGMPRRSTSQLPARRGMLPFGWSTPVLEFFDGHAGGSAGSAFGVAFRVHAATPKAAPSAT